jgi:plastocyanin
MRRLTPFAILAALALGACTSDDPEPTAPDAPQTASVTASATANTFSPSTVTIARGGTVTWTFGARPHNVTFGATGAPASVPTTTNAQVARQFPTAGSFAYDCTLHAGMSGTVVVQ